MQSIAAVSPIECPKCRQAYLSLACGNCVMVENRKMLSQRLAESISRKADLSFTKDGHLTLSKIGWRRVWKVLGMSPRSECEVATVCGSYPSFKQITEYSSGLDTAKAAVSFVPCKECMDGAPRR